jgi:hypothetical protein
LQRDSRSKELALDLKAASPDAALFCPQARFFKWRSALVTLKIIGFVLCGLMPALCQCTPADAAQMTRWGNNPKFAKEAKPMKALNGTVLEPSGHPLERTLVEVFDHPEMVSPDASPHSTGQSRLRACMTGNDGRVSFDLPDGRYELRFSKQGDWSATSVLVKIRKKSWHKKELTVYLTLSI